MKRTLISVTLLMTTGCAYWGRRPVDQPVPVPKDSPVWIWSATGVQKWHAVVVSQDSIAGVPYKMSVKCDSCRRSLPRTQVDSAKTGYRTKGETVFDITSLLALVTIGDGLMCMVIAPHDPQC